MHPRHPPRLFPLGLLAPRCLGLALLLAIARLRAGGSGAMLFGGRKESFPQLRLGSCSLRSHSAERNRAHPTRLAQPPSSFSYPRFVVSLSLLDFLLQDNGGAHPLVMDALAEMPEAQIPYVLAPPTQCAHIPPAKGRRDRGRGSLRFTMNL